MSKQLQRSFSLEFKLVALGRMERGETIASLSAAFGVHRQLLYKWRDAQRAGRLGRRRGWPTKAQVLARETSIREVGELEAARRRVAELERKAALDMALADRRPPLGELVHHSDRGRAVRLRRLCPPAGRGSRHPQHEPRWLSPRQRQGRELHEDAQAGGSGRLDLPRLDPCPLLHRRLHRRRLQPHPAALSPRLPITHGVRKRPARSVDCDPAAHRPYNNCPPLKLSHRRGAVHLGIFSLI
jgi:transposase-like protein